MNSERLEPMARAVQLAEATARAGFGGPFGAVVVQGDQIVGEGANEVLRRSDPTAHAEILAIRDACSHLESPHLDGCVLFTTCEPCPMCLGAVHWARIETVYFALDRTDAAAMGFADADLHTCTAPASETRRGMLLPFGRGLAIPLMTLWSSLEGRVGYGPPASDAPPR